MLARGVAAVSASWAVWVAGSLIQHRSDQPGTHMVLVTNPTTPEVLIDGVCGAEDPVGEAELVQIRAWPSR